MYIRVVLCCVVSYAVVVNRDRRTGYRIKAGHGHYLLFISFLFGKFRRVIAAHPFAAFNFLAIEIYS
jgi:hypothetical protein